MDRESEPTRSSSTAHRMGGEPAAPEKGRFAALKQLTSIALRRPRVLGATKRRFEAKRYLFHREAKVRDLSTLVFSWYQFSREGNSAGLRRAYVRWPLDSRLKRRRRTKKLARRVA